MLKILLTFASSLLLVSCATAPNGNINSEVEIKAGIVGIWAMHPLRNGIANVAEFTKEGKSNLHSFNCREKSTGEIESYTYTISSDGREINLELNGEVQELKIVSINENSMTLGQKVGDSLLKFSYVKTDRISPLCHLHKEPRRRR